MAAHSAEALAEEGQLSITLRVYAHYLPDASRRDADRLDTLDSAATSAPPDAPRRSRVIVASSSE